MAEQTGIAWTDHTHNPWWGCTKVSPGCDHCYAEAFDKRVGGAHWGPHAERRRIGETTRNLPLKWNRQAEKAGVRRRVFCASMADVFDNAVPPEWRDDLWTLIRQCPALDFQLLTKRPQNIAKMLPSDWGNGWPNVWLGCTAENQEEADRRIPHLLRVPAAVRFLSCEPLLSGLDLRKYLDGHEDNGVAPGRPVGTCIGYTPPVDWVIVGGESGHGARPMQRQWAEGLLQQCRTAGVPVFFKQTGSNRNVEWPDTITGKGDDPTQWPDEMRVQEFPLP